MLWLRAHQRERRALHEHLRRAPRRWDSRTVHHRLVHFPGSLASGSANLVGEYLSVRITEALAHSVVGEVVPHSAMAVSQTP